MKKEVKIVQQGETELTLHAEGTELIIREGKAAEIYPPEAVNLGGNIFAPGEFLLKRQKEVEAFKDVTYVFVNYDGLTIELVINEKDKFKTRISGALTPFKDLQDFGINQNKNYSVSDLYKMLRLKRAFFKNRDAHATILDQLKKFEAKTIIEFKNINDFKGHTALQKIQDCKTNLSYNFILNIEIYKGTPKSDIPVEIEFEPHDGGIKCWLISEDLAEMEVKQRDEIMNTEVNKFSAFPVIKR